MTSTSTAPAAASTKPFQATSLAASLTVKDVAASINWYTDVVGFTIDQKYERDGKLAGAAFTAGGVRLMVNQDDGKKGWDRTKGEGMSLMITTTQDVDALARRITSHGGRLESEPKDMPWGMRVFRVEDPDGFKIAFARPLDAAATA